MAYRFRSILHRVLSMDDNVLNPKDDSRPAYARPPCCMGIYIDALDARPDKNTTVGSQHAFMMSVMDKMLEYLQTQDLCKIKGGLETRKICDGVILERFRHGCILEVTFDTSDSVENLWTLHTKNRLTSAIQDLLIDKSLLKATNAAKITLRAKLWEDEYLACKQELVTRNTARIKLATIANDLANVKRVQAYIKGMEATVSKARDAESKFEHSLGEFMLKVKQCYPQSTTTVRNLKEFTTSMKMARGINPKSFTTIDEFFKTIEFFRKLFQDIEREIVHPLCQVRALCENDQQRNLKKTIKAACSEVLTVLQPDTDLQKVRHKEWGPKVLQREQGIFYGLISLIPISLDRLTTIDVSAEEYVNQYPEMASK